MRKAGARADGGGEEQQPVDWDDQAVERDDGEAPEADFAVGPETPGADAAEQRTPVGGEPDAGTPGGRFGANPDVNEADAADQERAVEFDEDDYR